MTGESFSPNRRYSIAASVVLSLAAVLALVLLTNYLALHHAPRLYWGASSDYRLSPLTVTALDSLTNQVKVTVFFDREHPVYPSVRALLREYAARSPRLTIEELDYTRDPVAGVEFRRRFPRLGPQDEPPDLVLFESGARSKAVPARDLRDYDTRALMRGEKEALPTAFRGEVLFTSAINAVCEGRPRLVFFLQGHGELDFKSDELHGGCGRFAALLTADNIELGALRLNPGDEIPRDCELLVIAGARDRFTPPELQALDRYLRRGGRLLNLFHHRAATGLESLLFGWGIHAPDSLVLDPENSDKGVLIASRFGNHPVTRPLANSRLFLGLPRAVDVRPVTEILGAPARLESLLRTGTNGIAVTTFTVGGYRFAPDDRRGNLSVGAAVERGSLPGVAASLGTTRIVAMGDDAFLGNQLIEGAGNRHFGISSVNWLLDRSHLLGGIQPLPIRTYQVVMTPFQQRMLAWLLLAILPGGALAVGFFVWARRH